MSYEDLSGLYAEAATKDLVRAVDDLRKKLAALEERIRVLEANQGCFRGKN